MGLEEKFTTLRGRTYMTGIDALVRLPLDQRRRDARRGLRTAVFISGYPGSPLAGYDVALERRSALLDAHDVVHRPGVNEELAATSVYGSQLVDMFPGAKFDGVIGMWYGKSPGADRSGDAFKHGNFIGTSRHGAVLVLGGDDHAAKSSTLPCQSDFVFLSAGFPILYPGNVQEVLDLGLHGIALSRYSGAWVALKLVTNVCDGGATVAVDPERPSIVLPKLLLDGRPYEKVRDTRLFPPHNISLEREVHDRRMQAALAYARANRLVRTVVESPHARIGIATAGKSYYDTRRALELLALDDEALARGGVRLLRADMIFPLEPEAIIEFAAGLEEVLVIEEKRAFLETQIREVLYNTPGHPRVYGKRDESGRELFPIARELDPDTIASALVERLGRLGIRGLPEAEAWRRSRTVSLPPLPPRLPNFCSGCPHNVSTVALEGELTGLGIGCHGMAVFRDGTEHFFYITQMGGEGAPWIAIAPFTETKHFFQQLGDGTYAHSGALSVAACAAAGVDITFKLLYNDAVAMTGGQSPAGGITIPELTQKLRAEGARDIYLVSDDPSRYPDLDRLAPGVKVYERDRLSDALRASEAAAGVSVVIYDQMCARKKRRLRKRGVIEDASIRVAIHPEVCEGCGDCGAKSNCMSLRPLETEFGTKTTIDASSCNVDLTCMKGDCPSFVTVEVGPDFRTREHAGERPAAPSNLPEPSPRVEAGRRYAIYLRGIGGTGVVTANALIATAAALEQKHVLTLDQTGLAQMGGTVASHLVISDEPLETANTVSARSADLILALDVLGAADGDTLRLGDPGRTMAVVNTAHVPTGAMVRDRQIAFPAAELLHSRIDAATTPGKNIYLDAAGIARRVFGSELYANLICLGAAYQAGLLPVSSAALEQAIRLNAVDVEDNLAAFAWGRQARIDPDSVRRALAPTERRDAGPDLEELQRAGKSAAYRKLVEALPDAPELRRLMALRLAELLLYQDADYARRYRDRVLEVHSAESARMRGRSALAEAAARYLYKLMAYKDEYEVARLLVRPRFRRELDETYAAGAHEAFHLHPPALRAMGLERKIRIPAWLGRPMLGALYRLRFLRGTAWDPFGRNTVRRQERDLVRWYDELLDRLLEVLGPENYDAAVEIAALPDLIRGYEEIKLASIAKTRELAEEKLRAITRAA